MRVFALFRTVALLTTSSWLPAQAPAPQPEPSFEVVSVKYSGAASFVQYGPGPGVTMQFHPFRYAGDRVTCDLTLREIIKEAFSIDEDYRIVGPDWIGAEKFQIAAIMPRGTTRDVGRLMLQTMLRERFGLRYKLEKRGGECYALVKGNRDFRLRGVDPIKAKDRVIETPAGINRGGTAEWAGGFSAVAISLREFCSSFLSKRMDAPVLDMTGVPGAFEIDLRWDSPEGYALNNPEMLRAIEQKLGLKLEKRKLSLDALIIEHLDKMPTEN